jgi:hypothetical protein
MGYLGNKPLQDVIIKYDLTCILQHFRNQPNRIPQDECL